MNALPRHTQVRSSQDMRTACCAALTCRLASVIVKAISWTHRVLISAAWSIQSRSASHHRGRGSRPRAPSKFQSASRSIQRFSPTGFIHHAAARRIKPYSLDRHDFSPEKSRRRNILMDLFRTNSGASISGYRTSCLRRGVQVTSCPERTPLALERRKRAAGADKGFPGFCSRNPLQ